MKIVDSHQHLLDLDLFSYSWCKDIPALNHSFRIPDYLEATREIDLFKSVHIEADVDEPWMLAETRHVLALAEGDNPLQGVVACGRPESPSFRVYLDQIAGHPKLKGIRRVLHTQPDELATAHGFIENIRLLERYGLSFDICASKRQLPVAINLVQECPGVFFILDHCGNPPVKDKVLHPWREHIEEISRFPNVVCKVSGIVTNADCENWTAEDLRPYVNHVIQCFGWDRVIFGSDWPVCILSATYKEWVTALLSLTEGAKESDRERLFWKNAERVYRLA